MLELPCLILRGPCQPNLTDRYVLWLNDPYVNRFLATHFSPHTIAFASVANVEYCEINPESAYEFNVTLVSQVAIPCLKPDIPHAHTSTDNLFSGLDAYSDEENSPLLINVYSKPKPKPKPKPKTKAIAERKVGSECMNSSIVRKIFLE